MNREEMHFILVATSSDGAEPYLWKDKVVFTPQADFGDVLEFGLSSMICSILEQRGKRVKIVKDETESAVVNEV